MREIERDQHQIARQKPVSGTRRKPRRPVHRLDRRTPEYREIARLSAAYVQALGGPDAIGRPLMEKVTAAAEMTVIASVARARFLRGGADAPPLDDVVRAERASAAAVAKLQIDHSKRSADDEDDVVGEYLAGQAA